MRVLSPSRHESKHAPSSRRVRVLLTGFANFPALPNHPGRFDPLGKTRRRVLANSSSIVASQLEAPPGVELIRLVDVPVLYRVAARQICAALLDHRPEMVLCLGMSTRFDGDAKLEMWAQNALWDDGGVYPDLAPRSFQLPADWPPEGPVSFWSEADRAWLARYPDNSGSSFFRTPIDTSGPLFRKTRLPVEAMVAEIARRQLDVTIDTSHTGQAELRRRAGAGSFICNETFYSLLATLEQTGGDGGLIHLPPLTQANRHRVFAAVGLAVEVGARHYAEKRRM